MTEQILTRLIEVGPGEVPTVWGDAYVPLGIRWPVPRDGQGTEPFYLRPSGLAGGELELSIDRKSGQLFDLTIIEFGAMANDDPTPYPDVPHEQGCLLVLDPAMWRAAKKNWLSIDWLMKFYRLPAGVRIDIDGIRPVRLVDCGPQLIFGLGADGSFASLTARIEVQEHHFQS
jgi:hypothetical protein